MIEANVCPFWSRLIRLSTEVFGSKNAVQLAVISATALPPVAGAEDDVFVADGAGVDVELAPEPGVELEVDPLLPQAATLVPSAHTSMISGIEDRVFTQTFSSFPLTLAMQCLTLTSARRRDRARRSASPAAPARTPG